MPPHPIVSTQAPGGVEGGFPFSAPPHPIAPIDEPWGVSIALHWDWGGGLKGPAPPLGNHAGRAEGSTFVPPPQLFFWGGGGGLGVVTSLPPPPPSPLPKLPP